MTNHDVAVERLECISVVDSPLSITSRITALGRPSVRPSVACLAVTAEGTRQSNTRRTDTDGCVIACRRASRDQELNFLNAILREKKHRCTSSFGIDAVFLKIFWFQYLALWAWKCLIPPQKIGVLWYHENPFGGFGFTGGRILPFPITLANDYWLL